MNVRLRRVEVLNARYTLEHSLLVRILHIAVHSSCRKNTRKKSERMTYLSKSFHGRNIMESI